jgi:hypothetical protein
MKSPVTFPTWLSRAFCGALALACLLALNPSESLSLRAEKDSNLDHPTDVDHDETDPVHQDAESGGLVHLTEKQLADFDVTVDVAGPVKLWL